MTGGDLVSIVIPCYKQARFLPRAIESVLNQTYKPIEIVVVDDGSPDDTSDVAAGYANVRVIRTSNQGLSAARNNGLRASSGSLLVFLDADDRLRPDAVARGVACLDAHPASGIVYGNHVRFFSDGTPADTQQLEPLKGDIFEMLLRKDIVGCVDAVLWRRDALAAVGGFEVGLNASEDYDIYMRIARRFPIAQHDAVVAEVFLHDSNMHGDFARQLEGAVRALRRQRSAALRKPGYRKAYKEGLTNVRLTYGPRLARRIARQLRSPSTRAKALRDLAILLRFYPSAPLHAARRAPKLIRDHEVSDRAARPEQW